MVLRQKGSKITTGLELRIRLILSGVERTGDSAAFLYGSYGFWYRSKINQGALFIYVIPVPVYEIRNAFIDRS